MVILLLVLMSQPQTFTISNAAGMTAQISNYGARLLSLSVPDKDGVFRDVVLGFDNIENYYPEENHSDMGATIGRYANRIANGKVTIEEKTYRLPQNDGTNCLHGGPNSWQTKIFDVESVQPDEITMRLKSPDGENGFPGAIDLKVRYQLLPNNTLVISYEATASQPTVINLTNHSYFNLNKDHNLPITNHLLKINGSTYLPIDGNFLPVGDPVPLKGTPFDFSNWRTVGTVLQTQNEQLEIAHGIDHCFVLDHTSKNNTAIASLASPETNIVMNVFTSEPGVQVYTANFLEDNLKGKNGTIYQKHCGICLETQKFPDSPNRNWPQSNAYITPEKPFYSVTSFQFEVSDISQFLQSNDKR